MRLLYCVAFAFVCLLTYAPKAQSTTLEELLQHMATHSQQTESLQAEFTQDKKLQFLEKPLRSQGHLFFTKNHNASGTPALLWEYLQPAPSGIVFQNNTGWIWMQERAQIKKAQGHEGRMLTSMIEQMLLWFVFEPQQLQERYTIRLLPQTATEKNPCLDLQPKSKGPFSSMNICINTANYTLHSLQFHEQEGDSTSLFFTNLQLNTPYPTAFPDGTPLP